MTLNIVVVFVSHYVGFMGLGLGLCGSYMVGCSGGTAVWNAGVTLVVEHK